MANEKQLKILTSGAKAWNQWRQENPGKRLDFRNAALKGIVLDNAELYQVNLDGADFTEGDLRNVDFSWASLVGAVLNLADLGSATLDGADFTSADLTGVDLRDAALYGTNLTKANLTNVDLEGANLVGASLVGANLTGANLIQTSLDSSPMSGANLSQAIMQGTHIVDTDLKEVKNLDQVEHHGPSSIGIDTIYKSKGDIPHKFLRGAGVPENFITYMSSLTGKAFEYFSAFISYTEADDAISKRLHADLQAAGLRVWRWRENARTGELMHTEINKAIRLHDKVVVICSGNSLHSEPVLDEIREALEKEAEFKAAGNPRTVLFPIRIDDYVFDWEHEFADAVRARFIGDFRNWTDPNEYKKSFDKLVADLNKPQDEE